MDRQRQVLHFLLGLFDRLGFAKAGDPLAVGVEEEIQTWDMDRPGRGVGAVTLLHRLAPRASDLHARLAVEDGRLVGVRMDGVEVTTDAGKRQIELIFDPMTSVHQYARVAQQTHGLCTDALGPRIHMLGMGHHPVARSTPADWIPKQRYTVLRRALPTAVNGTCDTAGLQATVDTRSPRHMLQVANGFNALSGPIAAVTTNSSLASRRAMPECLGSRLFTWNRLAPPERYGVKVFRTIEDYMYWVLNTPVLLFLDRNKQARASDGRPFWQWVLPDVLTGDTDMVMWKFLIHTGCLWPEARIRPFNRIASVEGRTPCAQPQGHAPSVVALYVGLAERADDMETLTESVSIPDWAAARTSCARSGLRGRVNGYHATDLVREMLGIAHQGLRDRGQGEERLLDLLYERMESGRTPADDMLETLRRGGIESVIAQRAFTVAD